MANIPDASPSTIFAPLVVAVVIGSVSAIGIVSILPPPIGASAIEYVNQAGRYEIASTMLIVAVWSLVLLGVSRSLYSRIEWRKPKAKGTDGWLERNVWSRLFYCRRTAPAYSALNKAAEARWSSRAAIPFVSLSFDEKVAVQCSVLTDGSSDTISRASIWASISQCFVVHNVVVGVVISFSGWSFSELAWWVPVMVIGLVNAKGAASNDDFDDAVRVAVFLNRYPPASDPAVTLREQVQERETVSI